MYGPFGSVRSLPPQRMKNIRHMFEEPSDTSLATHSETDNEDQSSKHSYENVTITPTKRQLVKKSPPPVPKWREHITPSNSPRPHSSPTRNVRISKSPIRGRHVEADNADTVSRANDKQTVTTSSHLPVNSQTNTTQIQNKPSSMMPVKPAPTKGSLGYGEGNAARSTNPGLGELPIAKLGQIMSGVALSVTEDASAANRVSMLIGHLESNVPETNEGDGKPQASLSPLNLSPARRIQNGNSANCGTYSKLFEVNERKANRNGDRPVSVFERTKMFEATDNAASSGRTSKPALPAKPQLLTDSNSETSKSSDSGTCIRPSPMKRRSQSERKSNEYKHDETLSKTADPAATSENTSKLAKPKRPLIPPLRQRSLTEPRQASGNDNQANEIITANPIPTADKTSGKPNPPGPPMKPPRTGVHDDYIKVKLEKERKAKLEMVDSYEDCDSIIIPKVLKTPASSSTKIQNGNSNSLGRKPVRPPPPRRKPRPFSIATDTISYGSSEESDSDTEPKIDNPFYETVAPAELDSQSHDHYGAIRHWDLPRQTHPEPIRRSLSDDCIHKAVDKAVDNEGNVVYMDPDVLGIGEGGGYDIYVDSVGYAVPHRVVKRTVSMEDGEDSEPPRAIGDRMKSKFRRFKNLFSEADKPAATEKSLTHRSSQSSGNKLDIVKQKINQAFEVLQGGSWRQQRFGSGVAGDQEDEEDTGETSSTDSESRVDEKEIRKRVEYSRSVRIKTSASIRATQTYAEKIYPQLFEYAMIVSLQYSQESGEYEPYVKYKFPEIKQTNVSVPQFCFPDAANFKPSSSSAKSQSYNFVLTNFDGGRVYGYCRRLLPPKSPNKLPEVICVISPVESFLMYNTLLLEIEKKRLLSLELAQEMIAAAFGRPLPAPGKSSIVRTLDVEGEMETIFLNRETDSRMDNVNVECLLSSLGVDKLLKVFSSVLLERSVLFCAKHLGVLSSTIHALISLLYPFSWQHTFVPVLPASMIDVVCSPTPYIMGITTSLMQHALTLPLDENVLVFDLDKRSLVRSQGDEGTLLPKKIEKALKTALNMCRIDADARSSPNLMISEAFLRFFVEVVGHYGQCIITQPGGQKTFQKEEFVGGASSSSLRQLLEWFVETQMFEVFITNQLERTEWGNTIEYFQGRIQEYRSSRRRSRRQRLMKR